MPLLWASAFLPPRPSLWWPLSLGPLQLDLASGPLDLDLPLGLDFGLSLMLKPCFVLNLLCVLSPNPWQGSKHQPVPGTALWVNSSAPLRSHPVG